MGPLKRLIGGLFFLYTGEEEKARGEERLSKHPKVSKSILSASPKPRQSVPKASPKLPKASPKPPQMRPKLPQRLPKLPQSVPELPQSLPKPPQKRPQSLPNHRLDSRGASE